MWRMEDAPRLAAEHVGSLVPRWSHVQTVGRLADALVRSHGLSSAVVAAAWLHDVGYGSRVAVTGFHPLDGAVFLRELGAPEDVVGLVAHHTGAAVEAAERGLADALAELPRPEPDELDALTLVDLVSAPDGSVTNPLSRIAEILSRYSPDDPVHRAVSRSGPQLIAAAARARARLGLPDVWPVGVLEGVREA